MAKICDTCACYEVCIYANPNRTIDCTLWKPDMEWIPVTERLPDCFGEYIVAVKDVSGQMYSDYADFDLFRKHWTTGLFLGVKDKVTHWMELPDPPKEDKT